MNVYTHTYTYIYISSRFVYLPLNLIASNIRLKKKKENLPTERATNIKEDYKWELIKIKEKKNRKVYDPRGIFYSPARNDVITPTIYATFDR